MNSLLQTFFIAIFGVLILTSPAEKRLPAASFNVSAQAESNATLDEEKFIAEKENIDFESIGKEGYGQGTAKEVSGSNKPSAVEESPKGNSFTPYLSKGLTKFFIFVGRFTGFEKLGNSMVSQGL